MCRQRFTSAQMLQLLAALVKCVYGNDTTTSQNGFSLETMYEMVWSHSEFLPVMCSSHDSQEGLVRVKGEMTMLLCACWHTLILSGVLNTKVCYFNRATGGVAGNSGRIGAICVQEFPHYCPVGCLLCNQQPSR